MIVFRWNQLVFLSLLIACCSSTVFANEKQNVLKNCERMFGRPVDEKLNLFEINKDFVLRVDFVGNGLEKLSVEPKYWLSENHPEWIEPDERPRLQKSDYDDLISKFEQLKSKGGIIARGHSGFCSNLHCWFQEYYENAFVEYAGNQFGPGFDYFFISFFQSIRGEIVDKKVFKLSRVTAGLQSHHQTQLIYWVSVLVEGDETERFYVRKGVYKRLKKGKTQSFEACFIN